MTIALVASQLLKEAGVEVVPPPPPKSPRQSPCNSPAKPQKGRPQQQQPAPPPARPWPYPALAVDQLSSVVCDLSDAKAALPAALKSVRGDKTDRPGAIRVGMLLHCPPPSMLCTARRITQSPLVVSWCLQILSPLHPSAVSWPGSGS